MPPPPDTDDHHPAWMIVNIPLAIVLLAMIATLSFKLTAKPDPPQPPVDYGGRVVKSISEHDQRVIVRFTDRSSVEVTGYKGAHLPKD